MIDSGPGQEFSAPARGDVPNRAGAFRARLSRRLLLLRLALAPRGTRRGEIDRLAWRALATWKKEGGLGVVSRLGGKAWRAITRQRPCDGWEDDLRYREWLARNEPGPEELERQRRQSTELPRRPLISILTPVYNTPVPILDATIGSVLAQTYDRWELCLADGGSDDPRVREALLGWAARDPRIRVELLAENRGISGNSNAALAMVRGEFLALLDHDDLLAPSALFENALALNRHPEADFLYSDRDLISEDGSRRFQPFFKPGWSPEIMLTANYLTHLCVLRASLVREAGGFDSSTDGAQDWDLFLRVIARSREVVHIPKVLYHWRHWSRSTASGADAKPYAQEGQVRTLRAHYRREGISGELVPTPSGFGRIRPVEPAGRRVSIVIVPEPGSGLWPGCVRRLLDRTRYDDFEVLLVRAGGGPSPHREARHGVEDPRVRLLEHPGPATPAALANFGARCGTGDALVFFSERLVVDSPDWLLEMAQLVERPAIGAVGAKLLHADGSLHHAGLVIGLDGLVGRPYAGAPDSYTGTLGHTEWYRNYLAVSGDCLLVPRAVFEEAGGFDEAYESGGADVDLCLRIGELGRRVVYTPFAKLWRVGSWGLPEGLSPADAGRLRARCAPYLLAGDRYFPPQAARRSGVPTLAVPCPPGVTSDRHRPGRAPHAGRRTSASVPPR